MMHGDQLLTYPITTSLLKINQNQRNRTKLKIRIDLSIQKDQQNSRADDSPKTDESNFEIELFNTESYGRGLFYVLPLKNEYTSAQENLTKDEGMF